MTWTDRYPWTEDEGLAPGEHSTYRTAADLYVSVLTWIHIYAFSHTQASSSAATSIRIYYEAVSAQDFAALGSPSYYNAKVPFGISIFPQEIVIVPHM